jgi:hypothetical protein
MYNSQFFKLLLFGLILDLLIDKMIGEINKLRRMMTYVNELKKTEYEELSDSEFVQHLKYEISKYQQYKIENRNKKKEIVFLQSNDKTITSYKAFPLYNWKSIIIIPRDTNLGNTTQQVLLAHEVAHCMGNDVLYAIIINIYILCILAPIVTFSFAGLSWKGPVVVLLVAILFKMQVWCNFYAEIIANNLSMEILENIPERISKRISAKILLFPLKLKYDKLRQSRRLKDMIRTNMLKIQMSYLNLAIKNDVLIDKISPINFPMLLLMAGIIAVTLSTCSNQYLSRILISSRAAIIATMLILVVSVIMTVSLSLIEGREKWKIMRIIGI